MATMPRVSAATIDASLLFEEEMARLKAAREILARQDAERVEKNYLEEETELLLQKKKLVGQAMDRLVKRLARLDEDIRAAEELMDEL